MPDNYTSHIAELYKLSTAQERATMRETYPRMKVEFDAIDRDEERQARIAAQEAQHARS